MAPSVANKTKQRRGADGAFSGSPTQVAENSICEAIARTDREIAFVPDAVASFGRQIDRIISGLASMRDALAAHSDGTMAQLQASRESMVAVNRQLSAASASAPWPVRSEVPFSCEEHQQATVAAVVRAHDALRAHRQRFSASEQAFRDENLLRVLAHNLCPHPDSHYGLCPPDETHAEPYYMCDLCRNSWEPGESRDDEAVA